MRKVYIDLAIVIVCIILIFKFTGLFLLLAGLLAVVWFLVLDDTKKKEIKDKISNLYKE